MARNIGSCLITWMHNQDSLTYNHTGSFAYKCTGAIYGSLVN